MKTWFVKPFIIVGLILTLVPLLSFARGAKEEKPVRMALSGNQIPWIHRKLPVPLRFR